VTISTPAKENGSINNDLADFLESGSASKRARTTVSTADGDNKIADDRPVRNPDCLREEEFTTEKGEKKLFVTYIGSRHASTTFGVVGRPQRRCLDRRQRREHANGRSSSVRCA